MVADSGSDGAGAGADQLTGPGLAKWHRHFALQDCLNATPLTPRVGGERDWWRVCCAGVLAKQEGKGHWAALKRAFRLLVEEVDDQDPADAAYVFSGHCPLTVSAPPGPSELPGQHGIGPSWMELHVHPLMVMACAVKADLSRTPSSSWRGGASHAEIQHAQAYEALCRCGWWRRL